MGGPSLAVSLLWQGDYVINPMLYVFKKYSHNVFPYPCTLDRLLVLLSAKRNFRIWSQLVVLWAIFTKINYILIVLIFLVSPMGLEPMTQALKVLCATNCATKSYHDYSYFEILTSVINYSGKGRIRTSEAEAPDLQSGPFDHSGTFPILNKTQTISVVTFVRG